MAPPPGAMHEALDKGVDMATTEVQQPIPAGWAPDPWAPGGLRWWDGHEWTRFYTTAPVTQPAPLPASYLLPSERVVVSAPMSFTGSAQRIWGITRGANVWLKALLLGPIAVILIGFAWMFVGMWYATFGILVIPFRLMRRGQRRQHAADLRQRELIDAINSQRR